MDLVRSWLGQALRATGAAVVVPIAVLVALSISALGGGSGLGGLGSLSQILSGPQVAGSDLSVDSGESEISDAVTQLAAEPPRGGPGAPGPGFPGGDGAPLPGDGTGGGGGEGGSGDGRAPGGSVPPPGGGAPAPTPPGGGGGGGGGGGSGGDPPPPEPPGVVEGVGQGIEDATDGTPVAPTVEDAVDTLIEICGRLGCP